MKELTESYKNDIEKKQQELITLEQKLDNDSSKEPEIIEQVRTVAQTSSSINDEIKGK